MRTEELDYDLPPERIAIRPPAQRDGGRLLVLRGDALEDARVTDLPAQLPPGALVVVNDTRVLRARLLGRREGTGGRAEIFLLSPLGAGEGRAVRWLALSRASKPLRPGQRVLVADGALTATVVGRRAGERAIEVDLEAAGDRSVAEVVEAVGSVPLPPYLGREEEAEDATRYQTVFARRPGAVAAPTAGLHLSERVLGDLEARGVRVASCTLHVGLGTFEPVAAEDLDDHPMHAESYEIGEGLAAEIEAARDRGAPVVAIGTTVVRALESAADPTRPGRVRPTRGETRLCIQPGFRFRVVDALVTNFHLPRSTLLALVWAFAGEARARAAYAHAIAAGYRFYSYGDAMFVARRPDEVAP